MKTENALLPEQLDDEVGALIATLHATEQRLEELTGGEVDTVSDQHGRPYLLRRAQEELRYREADKQAAILDALPAHIALLDAQGGIVSVNETWRQFATANFLQGPEFGVGLNYLRICDRAHGNDSAEAGQAAAGIRLVLEGAKHFSLEYPCHSPTEQRWYLMTVSPLISSGARGAVVMHLNITERRQAEEASRATKKRLRDLIDGLGASMLVGLMTPDGILLEANAPALEAVGLKPEDVVGKPLADSQWFAYSAEVRQQLIDAIARGLRGEASRYDMKIRGTGERLIDIDFSLNPVRDEAGKIVFLVPSGSVITERKQAERELGRKTAILEAQLNSSIDGIVIVDQQGKKILQNRRTADLFKLPPGMASDSDDAPQVRWVKNVTVNPEQFAAKIAYLYAHPAEVSRDEVELKDGTILDRYSAPVVGLDGNSYGRIWTFRDITDQRRAAQELKQAKIAAVVREGAERYNFLADSVPLIIWTARPDGGVNYFNKAWFDYTGLALGQTMGWGWDAVLHPDDFQRTIDRWNHSFTTGENYEIEYRFKGAVDGSYRWFLGRGAARRNEAGEILQWVGTCTDIDDQKRAHSKLESRVAGRTAQLSRANEALQMENIERKQTESALRESNEKFHQLADNITDAFWIRSPDFSEVQYVSPAFEKIWGRTVASLRTDPHRWVEFVFADDRLRVKDAFAALSADRPSLDIEYRIVRPGGEIRWVRVRGFQVRNSDDQLIRHIGIVTDITEQRQAEAARRESEERFRSYFELGLIGMAITSPTKGFLEVNHELCRILQYEREELFVKKWAELTHPDDLAAENIRFGDIIAGKIDGYSMEKRFLRKDGEVVHAMIAVKAARRNDGTVGYLIGLLQDITEGKNAEDALRASEHRFKAVFEQAAVGVAQGDAATGQFVQVNQRFCEIVGRSRQEMEQLTFADITHPQDVDHSLKKARQLMAGTIREFSTEKRYVRKDQSEVWAGVTISAMWAPGEKPDYFIAVVQDITERKRLNEHLLQAQKMEALGQFSGGVAHDFNNILATISGYTELSLMILTDNPVVRSHLDSVLKASGRAADLVKQILTFSRQQSQERQTIPLQPVVEESIKLLRATIPSNIAFETSVAADAPNVLANANQVHQVLMNLGINAWHAMQDRPGRLQIRLERWVVDEAQASTQPRLRPGSYARVSVSDTGCGMNAATLQRIFDPFFTTKPPGQGTGLGLSVVHGIMDGHDGAVTVCSQPGEGTVFHLWFPAHTGEAAAGGIDEGPPPHGNGEAVLVVDDEELIATMIQQTLIRIGYAAEFATDPAAALALVRTDPQHFQLVLSDQTMPGLTGLVLATRLREIRPDLPVILMTGFSASLTPERLELAGVRQVLFKPLTVQMLGTALRAALSARHPN